MTNKPIASALCLILCPLLAAQYVGQAEEPVSVGTPAQTLFAYRSSLEARLHDSLFGDSLIHSDVPVELIPDNLSALAQATINSTVTFRIVHDVVVGQYAYGYGGTLIDVKVIRIREGKLRIRRGRMEPRVMEVAVAGLLETNPPTPPGALKLTLESSPRSNSSRTAKQLITLPLTLPLKAIHIVVLVPEYVLLGIACATGCDL
jgi:hypothetical protein